MFKTPEKDTYFHPVLTAEALLANPHFPHLLQKIKGRCGVKDLHYQALYEKLIPDFAEFVQAIPLRPKGKPGTLLVYALERAANSLEMYHREKEKEFDIRFAYALFTAALFQDIGKVIGQQRVAICDAKGEVIEDWFPHGGPMPEGKHYRLWFLGDYWISLSRFSTPLLARQIMSPSGFNWIAEDRPIYKMWLEALVGEGNDGENKLLKFFTMIDPGEAGASKKLPSLVLRPQYPPATKEGDKFWDWLKEGLESGKITVNQSDSMVFALATGEFFLVCPSIFQEFIKQQPAHLQWEQVCDQFNQLGMTDNLKEGKVSFDKYLIQKKEMHITSAHLVSAWGASHFAATKQKTATAKSERAGVDQMLREGIVMVRPEMLEMKNLAGKAESLKLTRQYTEKVKQQESREQVRLDQLLQASQTVSYQRGK